MTETHEFEKKLEKKVLIPFQNAKEWSDLLSIINELKNLIKKYPEDSINLYKISEKIPLSKRLSQCLNPSLPAGLHQSVYEAYNMILNNIKFNNENCLGEDLGLYSSGLFPSFQYVSAQNKNYFLKNIVKEIYISLLNKELELCLPGLLVSILPTLEEQNDERNKEIFAIFEDFQGKVNNYTFYGILWSLILRNERLRLGGMKYICHSVPNYEELIKKNEDINKLINNYFPNIDSLVVNTLCAVIESETEEVQIIRFGMDFIIFHFPLIEENKIISDELKSILLTSALKLFIKNEYSTTRRLMNWLMGKFEDENIKSNNKEFNYVLKILLNSMKKIFNKNIYISSNILNKNFKILEQLINQQVIFADFILKNLSYDIINCVCKCWLNELNESENEFNNNLIKKTYNFFNSDKNFIDFLWESLGNNLKEFKIEDEIDDILLTLKFCLIYLEVPSNENKVKYYLFIINNLLNLLVQIKINDRDSLKKIRQITLITLIFVKNLQTENKSNYNSIINEIKNTSLINISNESLLLTIKLNENLKELLLLLSKNIISYQNYFRLIINIFLNINKNEQITHNEINFFKQSVELIIRLEEYSQENNLNIPEWLFDIEKIIFNGHLNLSFESINYLLNILLTNFNEKDEIYNKIKNYLKTEKINLNENEIKNYLSKTNSNNNFFQIIICKLFFNLTNQLNQQKIINLLIKSYKIDNKIFINILESTLTIDNFEINTEGISLFTQFMKLTNEFYNNVIFFKNGECIFNMIDFLDHENPLFRYLSKSWLIQCINNINKIFDPLLVVLINNQNNFISNVVNKNGMENIFFNKEIESKRIINAFRKMKNIIINSSEIYVLLLNNKISENISNLINDKNFFGNDDYLFFIIWISLKFIQAKFNNENNENSDEIKKETISINSAAAEFLEILLINITDINKLMDISIKITQKLYIILLDNINNNNEVIQVQLLNLLKILLFNTKNVHYKYNIISTNLFSDEILIKSLNFGITREYFFTRSYYINFVENILPLFSRNLTSVNNINNLQNIAIYFITTQTDFLIKKVTYTKIKKKDAHKFSFLFNDLNRNSKILNYKFIFKNYLDEYKDYKTFDENDIQITLKGLKIILFHFLQINNNNINFNNKNNINWNEFKKLIINQNKTENLLTKFFSSNENENDNNNPYNIISKQIFFEKLTGLLAAFIISWINQSDEYENKDYCLNENGILAYIEENNKINVNNKDNIKQIILEISFCLFYKNPIEFMNCFVNIWCQIITILDEKNFKNNNNKEIINKFKVLENNNKYIKKIFEDKQYKLSMIEFLINLNVPFHIILFCLSKIINSRIKSIKYEKGKEKIYKSNYEESIYESKICHLIYSFFVLNNNKIDVKEFNLIWNEIINILNIIIYNSKIIYTFCWCYEIINLSLKKFDIKFIEDSNNVQKEIGEIFAQINKKLFDVSFNNKFESTFQSDENYLILPVLPSLYTNTTKTIFDDEDLYKKINENYNNKKNFNQIDNNNNENNNNENNNNNNNENNKNNENNSNNQLIIINEENPQNNNNNNNINTNINNNNEKETQNHTSDFYKFYHKVCILSSRYNEDRRQTTSSHVLNEIYRKISILTLKYLFSENLSLIYYDKPSNLKSNFTEIIKYLINTISDKNKFEFFIEISTDFLNDLMNFNNILTSQCGKNLIMDYFNSNSFFITTAKNLRTWKNIISNLCIYYKEIITDLLSNLDSGFIFLKASNESKIKTLRRISFVIYSCEKDFFRNKLEIIKDKVKILITQYGDIPLLESEIFLMIRILFLRFGHDNVMEMIKNLWPIIFSELVVNITQKKKNNSIKLILESFKFIELLSLANIEEFSLYQWIFIFDTFDLSKMDLYNKNNLLQVLINKESKIFKPYAINVIKNWMPENNFDKEKKGKSELVIINNNLNNIDNENDLGELVKKFFFSIGKMNNYKVKVNYDQIEFNIEQDFLFIDNNNNKK